MSDSEHNHSNFMLQYGTPNHIKEILKRTRDPHTKGARLSIALGNPEIDHEIADMAFEHVWSRIKAAKHPKISDATHDKALKFDNVDVQEAALMNPKTKIHHREERAKNSRFSYIREMAQEQIDDWRRIHKGDE